MKAYVGGGWAITHMTDRVIELKKDDYSYRRLTGRDGYVRIRAEPGMDRTVMIERAMKAAHKADTDLTFRVASDLIPSGKALADYRAKVGKMATAFATAEEPELIGVKKV